uniref:Neurotransmitter-gated ion-channel transmembrane domain-containing protein n=1 Tax=Romanomermis culicivorax TaxID=13658 RepID=A0A915IQ04_ROMCU
MCIISKRNTGAVGLEMSLPMIVSAVVLMCAQLAGKWKMQVYVKLFAILIQIFAFENLAPNDALSNATRTPKHYFADIFYNFTICLTIVSLFQTMLFWALSRRWFLMPPPYALTLHTKVVSRFLLGDKLERIHDAENRPIENGGGGANPTTNQNAQDLNNNNEAGSLNTKKYSNRKEWEAIFATLHAITSILIIVIYIVGVIVIYATY